ncbi:hypothetical protein I3271_05295 [Photobacterium leiognathi]|uniref:hypothetical protein n=1 Tax=Photobacterium leiognathi TaxID=553611 RepID=UPI001EDE0ACF|nr:hypothetical protein [Photobacterium leiognathi]MCG3884095.1 hypothetical protein [Photobacterium leiognathi]
MFYIPDFPLPSDISKVISFRVPTVRDCMMLADLNPEQDEAATTIFLNNQQDKDKQNGVIHDSLEWTGEDRRTALWWIYISTHEDTKLAYKFVINEEDRYIDIDLKNLGNTATTLSIAPKVAITFKAGDTEHSAFVKPLNGYALEQIESTVIQRNQFEPDSVQYRKLSNKIAMQEIIYSLSVNGEPDEREEAEEYRYQLIMNMPLEENFRSLVAEIVAAKRKLQHGLLTSYLDGSYMFIANVDVGGDSGEQPLMFPFQNHVFIPTL